MTREDVLKILTLLKTAYPNYYKGMSKEEANNLILLYQDMFEGCDTKLVFMAVKELINTLKFPPAIADIKTKMYELTQINDTSATEAWNELLKATKNGIYNSKEEFEKLSPECKEFVKSPSQIKELAQMDSEVINSVTKGQFLKQFEINKQRAKDKAMLLESTKRIQLDLGLVGKDISGILEEGKQ